MRWLFVPLGLVLSVPCWAAATCSANSGETRTPLVELYTAEGCNQCPPADRWLGTIAKAESDIAALSFHVDYWNEDGWVDPFSDAGYTERQKYRVRLAKKKALVTPQVMVGANATTDWRDPAAVRRALRIAREGAPEVDLSLAGTLSGDQAELKLTAMPKGGHAPAEPVILWLAMYQEGADSRITAGENRGVSIHHTHVVRKLAGPWKLDAAGTHGSLRVPLQGLDPATTGLVLFAESGKDARTLQSLVLPLRSCR